jgi:hypothetical protein
MLLIEAGLVVAAMLVAFAFPTLGESGFARSECLFARLARRRILSVVVVGLIALILRAVLLPILPIPQPVVSDEFSYLLGADTFAHARLTNPTHPMWVHFEALHVIQQPTYASKYPPAQAIFLAAGQVIAGHPFWGVWLSVGLMCATICWALQEWLGEGWALLGGLLAVLHLAVFSYWGNSYWGGAVAATGGALVLGALPRIKRFFRVRDSLLMGLGLAILANSRPYEGLVFSLPVAASLLLWMLGKNRPPLTLGIKHVFAPILLVLVLSAGTMGYYFWRVTGSPFRMPYQVFEATYDPAPYFLWQSLKPLPAYRHQDLKDWEVEVQIPQFVDMRSPIGFAIHETKGLTSLWLFFVGPLLTAPLLLSVIGLPYGFSWGDIGPPTRFLLLALAAWLVGITVEVQFFPHYGAPVTVLIFALALISIRRLHSWKFRAKPVGRSISRLLPVLAILLFVIRIAAAGHFQPTAPWTPWFSPTSRFRERASILSTLTPYPDRQLIFVRYGPEHFSGAASVPNDGRSEVDDWVYNGANIDAANVVWARDMGPVGNAELIHYFRNYRLWLLEADERPPRLYPYSEKESTLDRSASF